MGRPRPLYVYYFGLLSQQCDYKNKKCEKLTLITQGWDSNLQPLARESLPITSRPETK